MRLERVEKREMTMTKKQEMTMMKKREMTRTMRTMTMTR